MFFWAQQNLGGTKKLREHCPQMSPVATGLGALQHRVWKKITQRGADLFFAGKELQPAQ